MKRLLIATKNPGKIREIKEILKDTSLELITLEEINFRKDIRETGKSFKENAILKAKTIGEKTNLLTLAEDSGLEVDILDGRPGVLSARYTSGSDSDRVNKLLSEIKGIPREKRTARYKAIVALFVPKSVIRKENYYQIVTFEGESYGYITQKPIGQNGFGYDPIFLNLDLGKTNAEATLEEKNQVSHRARALNKLKEYLQYNLVG